MKNIIVSLLLCGGFLASPAIYVSAQDEKKAEKQEAKSELSLITATPEEGFQLAISLSRKSVKAIQPDVKVLFEQREVYAKDAEFLIAAAQVVAINYQTVAAANNYWRDKE